jgi:hypothetical protein
MRLSNLFSYLSTKTLAPQRHSALLCVLMFICGRMTAQLSCGTNSVSCAIGALPPLVQSGGDPFANAPIYIKVYVHVIRKPDGTGGQPNNAIDAAFETLRQDFTSHNIFFVRACEPINIIAPTLEFYGAYYYGKILVQDPTIQYPEDGINMILGPDEIDPFNGVLYPNGEARIAGNVFSTCGVWTTDQAGTPLPLPLVRSKTVSHEMGHCLGLWHTSEDGFNSTSGSCCELVNGDNNNRINCGDFVPDTDADIWLWRSAAIPAICEIDFIPGNGFCLLAGSNGSLPHRDMNGDTYIPPTTNIMAPQQLRQQCITGFTVGQRIRMRKVISICPILHACLLQPTGTIGNSFFTTTTWNTPRTMLDDITVPSGQELIIEAEVKMREGKKVLVERNARLIVRNAGKLTAMCDVWNGVNVLGNRYIPQPAHTAALNNLHQAGIVIVENGGTIENAHTGISTGAGYNHRNWGGVVYTAGAKFAGNRRDVEFMSYPGFLNKSRFNNTAFKPGKNNQPGYGMGVTIWETNDIKFTGCTFTGKTGDGILTYDAMIMVNGASNFSENGKGIASYATYPMASSTIIKDLDNPNVFTKNVIGIDASSVSGFFPATYTDGRFALDVVNNVFEDNSTAGIIIDGSSNYLIAGNDFNAFHPVNMWVVNTAYQNPNNQNLLICNNSNDFDLGIAAIGNNDGMQFLDNAFSNARFTDFILSDHFGAVGQISAIQGDPDNNEAALNCFSKPFSVNDIYTFMNTVPFDYYFDKSQANCSPEPVTPGNYDKLFILDAAPTDCSQFGGILPPICTYEELEERRNLLSALLPSISSDPSAKATYYSILPEKEAILKHLIGEALLDENYLFAEQLLSGEGTKAAQLAIYGLRVKRGDYVGAANQLSQLPIEGDNDATFHEVQLINLQRLQNLDSFALSTTQEDYLNAIAEGHSAVRGYARGILSLLKGNRYYPDPVELSLERSMRPSSAEVSALTAFPNPASNQISIVHPVFATEIKVIDCFGNLKFQKQLSSKNSVTTIPVGSFATGMYQALLIDGLGNTQHVRFVVQH